MPRSAIRNLCALSIPVFIVLNACGDDSSAEVPQEGPAPAPPSYAVVIPPYEQPKGDPAEGYRYLVNGEYVRTGPALDAFRDSGRPLEPRDTVPGREPQNAGLGYLFTAATADDGQRVAAPNCLACHASHLQGKLIIGLGRANHFVKTDSTGASVDVTSIVRADSSGLDNGLDFFVRLFRGALQGNHMNVFAELASHHDPKTLVWSDQSSFDSNSHLQGWVDFPPWWCTKKKNALYFNGTGRGVKAHHLQLMSFFSVASVEEASKIEQGFVHVNAWLDTLEAPKFPGEIDRGLATRGKNVFLKTCATCHGTYGETDAEDTYPNLLIPVSDVGTDPNLATNHWMYPAIDWYKESWYARNNDSSFERVNGYMAPPLDGIWATAPYFHNGSVPTLDAVIDPAKRPAIWTTDNSEDDYDLERVGWKDKPGEVQVLTLDFSFGRYDTSKSGYSNQGHVYGAALSAGDQRALLEYLKTL
ncbi:MAG TPA: c-type cytochrome [Polyangiales bacterium]